MRYLFYSLNYLSWVGERFSKKKSKRTNKRNCVNEYFGFNHYGIAIFCFETHVTRVRYCFDLFLLPFSKQFKSHFNLTSPPLPSPTLLSIIVEKTTITQTAIYWKQLNQSVYVILEKSNRFASFITVILPSSALIWRFIYWIRLRCLTEIKAPIYLQSMKSKAVKTWWVTIILSWWRWRLYKRNPP